MSGSALSVRWLGRVAFADALALQEKLVAEKRADSSLDDELLLLEHEPVYTIGRTRIMSLKCWHLPHPLFRLSRDQALSRPGPTDRPSDHRPAAQADLHRYLCWRNVTAGNTGRARNRRYDPASFDRCLD
jgi:lipoyl(octanoyl) transferase